MRFSSSQKRLGEAIKGVIDLYYTLKSLEQMEWHNETVTKALINIFTLTIPHFSPFVVRMGKGWMPTFYMRKEPINVSIYYYSEFLNFMDHLKTEIGRDSYKHLHIQKTIYEVADGKDIKKPEMYVENENLRYLWIYILEELSLNRERYENDVTLFDNRIVPKRKFLGRYDWGKDTEEIMDDFFSDYIPQQINGKKYYVKAITEFGKELVSDIYARRNEGIVNFPGSRTHLSSINFFDIVKSIFVFFHAEFGSFDRIRICRYCGHLYFESRKGKLYCSNDCNKAYSDELEPREKLFCRLRQKARLSTQYLKNPDLINWINSQTDPDRASKPARFTKKNCIRCTDPIPQKQKKWCTKLMKVNRGAFEIINKGRYKIVRNIVKKTLS